MNSNELITIEGLQTEIEALRKNKIAKLGDGTMFWIEETGKEKRGFKAKIDLSFPTQFCFPAGGKAKPMITAEGFDKLNQYAGIEVFKPKTLIYQDGSEKGNPYFETDNNGSLVAVMMRGIGIGYAPTGNLTAVDQTIYINLQTLLVQEIQAKMKKHPSCATLGVSGQQPEKIIYYETSGYGKNKKVGAMKEVSATGVWHFVPLHGQMGYWVNLAHPEIQDAFSSFSQKQRFLERTAFTILKRLILSSHPAIATKTPIVTSKEAGEYGSVNSAKAYAIVYGFRQTSDPQIKRKEMEAVADRLQKGEKIADMTIDVTKQEVLDVAEEAEIKDTALVADPTEIPKSDEIEEAVTIGNIIPVNEDKQDITQIEAKDKKENPTEVLHELFKNPDASPFIIKAKKALGFKTMSDIRNSDDDRKIEYIEKVKEMMTK